MTGFKIHYKVDGCPSNCSDRGDCNSGVCNCDSGYSGTDCSFEICPAKCKQGTCKEDGCYCEGGTAGSFYLLVRIIWIDNVF